MSEVFWDESAVVCTSTRVLTRVCNSRTTVWRKKNPAWPWWELVETMWNTQGGKTLWMSSVLEPHKVTSVLSNLVPMATNTPCSSSNVKIMSKQVHYVRSTNTDRNAATFPKLSWVEFLTLPEQTAPADTDMDDEAQCVIWIANLIQCDSESHSEVYFGKEDCWGPVCVSVRVRGT